MGKDRWIINIKKWEVYLINNLKINILINIDILAPKGIVIDLKWKTVIIYSYNSIKLKLLIELYVVNKFYQVIFINKYTIILLYFH